MMLKSKDESLTDWRGQLLSCPARLKKYPRCPLWLIPSPAIDIFNLHMCESKIIDKCLFDSSNTGSSRIVFLFLSRFQDLTHIRKYGVGTLVRINLRNKGWFGKEIRQTHTLIFRNLVRWLFNLNVLYLLWMISKWWIYRTIVNRIY